VPTSANDDLRAKLTYKPPKYKKFSATVSTKPTCSMRASRWLRWGEPISSREGKFYVRHELVSSLGNLEQLNGTQQQNSTVFGIDTTYLKDNHVFSEYRGVDAFPGYETEAAIGLRNVYTLRPGLKFSATAESVKRLTLTGTTQRRPRQTMRSP